MAKFKYQEEFSDHFFKAQKQVNKVNVLKKSWFVLGGFVFILLGLGFLVGSVKVAFDKYQFSQIASTAEGKVIDLVPIKTRDRETGRSRTTYAALVQFTAKDGRSYEFETTNSSNPPAYRRLAQVTVLYEEQNPEFAAIKDLRFYSVPIMLGIFAVAFIFAGLIVMFLSKNKQQS